LNEPVELRFTTFGFLEVTTVQPAEVATDGAVTVLFNRDEGCARP